MVLLKLAVVPVKSIENPKVKVPKVFLLIPNIYVPGVNEILGSILLRLELVLQPVGVAVEVFVLHSTIFPVFKFPHPLVVIFHRAQSKSEFV